MLDTLAIEDTTVDHLRRELRVSRAAVLSYLVKLGKCIDAQHQDLVQAVTQRFNEALIDYLSLGHFKLFNENPPSSHTLAALQNITNQALQFSERYANIQTYPLGTLKRDLEELALAMETRFEIEDELLGL